jgi:triacylglycerol lipase
MPADTMNPTTAVTYAPFIQAAEAQYSSDPSQLSPATITKMPAGYKLVRTIQMTDFFATQVSRVFYGYVAVGGDPQTAIVAIRGTETQMEWWDDFHWDLVPFTQVANGGNVASGFYDIYKSIGTMAPGQDASTSAPSAFAAEVKTAATTGLGTGLDPSDLPMVVTGHSLGGALATLLVAELIANQGMKPQAWTFASPRVGDSRFAACYGGLSTVSWRIYNQVDVVPYFPVDFTESYQPVTTGYAINSLASGPGKAKWSLSCAHSLNTYMHVLSPTTVPLDPACAPSGITAII